MKDLPCQCGHRMDKHKELNSKHWNRLNEQLKEYKDTPKNRAKFWRKFLLSRYLDEWKCSVCECDSFKQDNLKYLEDLYDKKK